MSLIDVPDLPYDTKPQLYGNEILLAQYVAPGSTPPLVQSSENRTEPPVGVAREALPTFVPFITLSERYDSNVLFGTNPVYDYVTNISPGVRWNIETTNIDGSLTGIMVTERYARNPGLSYIGSSGSIDLGLNRLAGSLIRNWSVRLTDSFMYTPQQPAFMAPEAGNQLTSSLVRGVQAFRNNSISNQGSVVSDLPLSPTISIGATYTNQFLKFFSKDPAVAGGLFNINSNSVSTGPRYRISPNHSVRLDYQYQHMAFSSTGGSALGDITTHGSMLTWSGNLSPLVQFELGGGAALLSNGSSLQQTGRAQVQYMGRGMTASVSFSRSIVPSYFLAAGALMSDVVSISANYDFSPRWSLTGAYNYSNNKLISSLPLTIVSHGPLGTLTYRVTPDIVAALSVMYFTMDYRSAGTADLVNRETVTFSIRAEWN